MDESFKEDDVFPMSVNEIEPYKFEPIIHESEDESVEKNYSSSESDNEGDMIEEQEILPTAAGERMDNVAWCDCENCVTMDTQEECICCHEVGPVYDKMEEEDVTCIINHEGFIGNCLNRHVLEVSMMEYVKEDGPIDDTEPINELYRHIAYRRFTRWIWHILGKKRRKVIPSCAVTKIRKTFPSEEYAGFKYARP